MGRKRPLAPSVCFGWKADISHEAIICYLSAMVENPEREAWMGLLHVRPLPQRTNPLEGVSGMGWVLALATDEDDFLRLVTAEMENIGLFVAEVDEVGRYSEFTSCSDTIVELFDRLSDTWPVQYHTFHTTMIDDA